MTVVTASSPREALAAALAAVEAHNADWRPWADLALLDVASRRETFTSDELWCVLIAHGIPHPTEHRAMGPVMLAGVKRGWIAATDRFHTTPDPATGRHPGPQRVYQSLMVGSPAPVWPRRKTDAPPQLELSW